MIGTFNGITGTLIADAAVPFLREGYSYGLTVTVNGVATSSPGINTIAGMAAWAQDTFGDVGIWAYGKDHIIVYANKDVRDVGISIALQVRIADFDSRDFDSRDFLVG
jgi:hypothetical protein